jgi:hypothetical protein
MKRKVFWIAVAVVIVMVLTSSGWVFNILSRNSELIKSNEMATLQTTFIQQYGSQAVIKQLVSPNKVYAALWTDGDGLSHVSWNIGGLWVTVFSSSNATSP